MESNHSETPPSFSLRGIAPWTPGVCPEEKTKIRASIPALQRGLVWTPQQNELPWDSILRGFPIGSVVVTKWSDKLKKTWYHSVGVAELVTPREETNLVATEPATVSDLAE
jgi:hypothetical protein